MFFKLLLEEFYKQGLCALGFLSSDALMFMAGSNGIFQKSSLYRIEVC